MLQPIYKLIDLLLPFSWTQYTFMKTAFLAVLIITPLFGMLGTMIVNHKMAFYSDALGHSALAGMALGVLLGISDGSISMVLFGVAFALLLNWIKQRQTLGNDTLISVLSSLCIAAGLAILSRGGDFSQYSSLLVGDILSIKQSDVLWLVGVFCLALVFWGLFFNKLHGSSIQRSLAASKGIPVKLTENIFGIFTAVVIMLSIKWVGMLLINALLILPAAAARNIASNMREYHLFSILFSVFSGVTGLILSFYIDVASGPVIVIIAAVIFFCTYFRGQE